MKSMTKFLQIIGNFSKNLPFVIIIIFYLFWNNKDISTLNHHMFNSINNDIFCFVLLTCYWHIYSYWSWEELKLNPESSMDLIYPLVSASSDETQRKRGRKGVEVIQPHFHTWPKIWCSNNTHFSFRSLLII